MGDWPILRSVSKGGCWGLSQGELGIDRFFGVTFS